jgi:ABC-2 type transport system ATP-binding protein
MQHAERLCERLLLLGKGRKRFEGTLDEARAQLPARLSIVARQPVDALAGVASSRPVGAPSAGWQEYDVELTPGTAAGDLLELCTQQGIGLRRFDERRASLHDVFLHIVGAPEPSA